MVFVDAPSPVPRRMSSSPCQRRDGDDRHTGRGRVLANALGVSSRPVILGISMSCHNHVEVVFGIPGRRPSDGAVFAGVDFVSFRFQETAQLLAEEIGVLGPGRIRGTAPSFVCGAVCWSYQSGWALRVISWRSTRRDRHLLVDQRAEDPRPLAGWLYQCPPQRSGYREAAAPAGRSPGRRP